MEELKFDITTHVLVPKHEKANDEEVDSLLKKFNISIKQLPMIKNNDPAIKPLALKIGEVVKITRKSPTVGDYVYYRVVING